MNRNLKISSAAHASVAQVRSMLDLRTRGYERPGFIFQLSAHLYHWIFCFHAVKTENATIGLQMFRLVLWKTLLQVPIRWYSHEGRYHKPWSYKIRTSGAKHRGVVQFRQIQITLVNFFWLFTGSDEFLLHKMEPNFGPRAGGERAF